VLDRQIEPARQRSAAGCGPRNCSVSTAPTSIARRASCTSAGASLAVS
jgi:hypothetical protein